MKVTINVRFLNSKQQETEPNEFWTWGEFYSYLKSRWNYSKYNFNVGAYRCDTNTYRFVTWAFVMIVTTTGKDLQHEPKRRPTSGVSRGSEKTDNSQ